MTELRDYCRSDEKGTMGYVLCPQCMTEIPYSTGLCHVSIPLRCPGCQAAFEVLEERGYDRQ